MICPECGEENNRVVDTFNKTNENMIERVRKCLCCGYPWVTYEYIPGKEEIKKKNFSHIEV